MTWYVSYITQLAQQKLIRGKISFNTQGSSQWDSLRHFAYQKEKKFYNGCVYPCPIHGRY